MALSSTASFKQYRVDLGSGLTAESLGKNVIKPDLSDAIERRIPSSRAHPVG
jgi:hypothetical protein